MKESIEKLFVNEIAHFKLGAPTMELKVGAGCLFVGAFQRSLGKFLKVGIDFRRRSFDENMLMRATVPKTTESSVLVGTSTFFDRVRKQAGIFTRRVLSFATRSMGTLGHFVCNGMQELTLGSLLTSRFKPVSTDFTFMQRIRTIRFKFGFKLHLHLRTDIFFFCCFLTHILFF